MKPNTDPKTHEKCWQAATVKSMIMPNEMVAPNLKVYGDCVDDTIREKIKNATVDGNKYSRPLKTTTPCD